MARLICDLNTFMYSVNIFYDFINVLDFDPVNLVNFGLGLSCFDLSSGLCEPYVGLKIMPTSSQPTGPSVAIKSQSRSETHQSK